MRRGAALGLVGVVFLAGLAVGGLGARLLRLGADLDVRRPASAPLQRYFAHRDLDLSAEQRRRLDEVLDRQRRKFEVLHRDLRPQVEALMDETEAELEAILSPSQLERFRHRRQRWQRHPDGRHPLRRRHPPGAESPNEPLPEDPPAVD